MLLGDARARDERSLDIEKTEHRLLHGERIRDERTANHRRARMEASGRELIREYEERPSISILQPVLRLTNHLILIISYSFNTSQGVA